MSLLPLNDDRCYDALVSRDPRFDGWFIVGVVTTGIYCRASCPTPVHPKRRNVRFFPTAAAAQRQGFRACKRCRPDAAPGSPEWDRRADLTARAMRLIADGVVDREGVGGLAERLAVSSRHLGRVMQAEVGAGPLAVARAHRAHTARVLLETTTMSATQVAFAAGFGSIRQFNDTIQEVYATSPGDLRRRAGRSRPADHAGWLSLRLPFRAPYDVGGVGHLLASHTVGGLDEVVHDALGPAYRRVLRLPRGPGIVELRFAPDHVSCRLSLTEVADLGAAVARCRRALDLDADAVLIDDVLAADPVLAPSVRRRPGVRVVGSTDPFETAIGAVVGQQVSVAGAATLLGRIIERTGAAIDDPGGGLRWRFPAPAAVAEADLDGLGLTRRRAATVRAVAAAVADGSLAIDPGADRARVRAQLLAIAGVGPWTADVIAVRALGDPDVSLAGDLAVRRSAAALGIDPAPLPLARHGERWAPWRTYAAMHLWHHHLRSPVAPGPAPAPSPRGGRRPTTTGTDATDPDPTAADATGTDPTATDPTEEHTA